MTNPNLNEFYEKLLTLKITEAAELAKMLEEKLGISATAPMAVAAAAPAAAAVAEKTEFDVMLVEAGANKIQVIKTIRSITSLDLIKAKELVDNVPKLVKTGVNANEAEELKKQLEESGAKVELK